MACKACVLKKADEVADINEFLYVLCGDTHKIDSNEIHPLGMAVINDRINQIINIMNSKCPECPKTVYAVFKSFNNINEKYELAKICSNKEIADKIAKNISNEHQAFTYITEMELI